METDACIFCAILAGKSPASFVHQDNLVAAFMTIEPVNPGHALIVPRQHVARLHELDHKLACRMSEVALGVEQALRRSQTPCDGVNLWLADGSAAGQDVFHVHLHVIPRRAGDNRVRWTLPPKPSRQELDRLADALQAAYPKP